MKIAIVCDWLITYAGSERCLGEILNCFPEADLFAVVDFVAPADRHFLQGKSVQTTFIQKLPFSKKRYRSYLPLMPLAIEQLDVSGYDLVISTSHAVAKGVITGPDQLHISYIYSPMRYAWDLQHQYLQESGLQKNLQGWFAKYFLHRLRLWDARTANGVDHFAAISKFIARRIWKTYRREADVIYPPVDMDFFTPHVQKEDFYVTASRLVPYKKVEMMVESFAEMPDKKFIVIGDGPDFAKIKAKATANVQMLGQISAEVLRDHLQRAKAFVFAAEEDFGIAPLEAQACGTPVIAYSKGAVLETIRDKNHAQASGLFYEEQTCKAFIKAVGDFEKQVDHFTLQNCVDNAARFSPEIFRQKFKAYVSDKCQEGNTK